MSFALKNIDQESSLVGTLQADQQQAAFEQLSNLSFPTRKTEQWKYTPIGKIINRDYEVKNDTDTVNVQSFLLEGIESYAVILNGVFRDDLSQINCENLVVTGVAKAKENYPKEFSAHFGKQVSNDEVFSAINTAFINDGAFVYGGKNVVEKKPVQILNICTQANTIVNARNLFLANIGAEFHIIETYHSINGESTLKNMVAEIYVSENASVEYDKVQLEEESINSIVTEEVYQEQNSKFKINTVTLGGATTRNNLNIAVDGENCETRLNGIYLCNQKQLVDNHTKVDHKKAHCFSSELYKGILDDQSTGVFNGKVFVRENAQKINAFQSNANIVISDQAKMNAKPELEIYADDVKCSHGSTTGQLGEEALFYLQSRGVSKEKAKKLLVTAFVADVLEEITFEPLNEKITGLVEERFN